VFECPVPGLRVCIRQVSPFLPHNYSDASLPVSVFHVEVENIGDGTSSKSKIKTRTINNRKFSE
jgi:uncharacterized protein (DUF608 family)